MAVYYTDTRSNARKSEAVNECKAYTDALQSTLKDGAFRNVNYNNFNYTDGTKLLTVTCQKGH
eukprot:3350334-Pleurochrysis_carterae.AAC.1